MNGHADELKGVRADTAAAGQGAAEVPAATGDIAAGRGQAQDRSDAMRTAQLVEANELLVLAALHAEEAAENAAAELKELTRSSQRDALTDTPNRALMLDRVGHAIAMARRRGTHIAVLFVDIDRFKTINDTLGHAAGDQALQLVARRLRAVVRDSDTVSRHGGDEFLLLLSEISSASDAALIAEKIRTALAAPGLVGDQLLCLSASIGTALYPQDGEDAPTLINRADAAMYRAKNRDARPSVSSGGIAGERDAGPDTVDVSQLAITSASQIPAEHEHHFRQLREANEELVLAALSAQELQTAAESALRRQIRLLATLAHELRNPLTPILTAAMLLKRVQLAEPLLPRLQSIIERQAVHMARLVDDLVDESRASTGKFRIERCSVDLTAILEQAVEACRPAMDDRQQHFSMKLPSCGLEVYGDPVRLVQVFVNLLHNAAKYTPERGEIAVTLATCGDEIAVTVSDNGIGITAAVLPHVFDLFVQDSRGRGFSGGGLGIGLAVVRELVEAHGGSVAASSRGNDFGSTFVVTLPMAGATPDACTR